MTIVEEPAEPEKPIRYPLGLSNARVAEKLRQLAADIGHAEVHPEIMTHTITNERKEWETETVTLTFTRRGTTKSGAADPEFE